MQYYQQGDVLLKKIEKLPEIGLKKSADLILQRGETTGHKHQFTMKSVEVLEVYGGALLNNGATIYPGIGKFIIVKEPAELFHEEHKPIMIAPGIYEMDLVREYDYEKDEVAYVQD